MKYQHLETTCLFKTAALICNGGELEKMVEQKRRVYSFRVKGRGIQQLDMDYRNGLASVNALQFRETYNHLKDMLFAKLRQGRNDDDKKRRYRANQKKR